MDLQAANEKAKILQDKISETEVLLASLRGQLQQTNTTIKTSEAYHNDNRVPDLDKIQSKSHQNLAGHKLPDAQWPLSADEYKRYGRQMIVPSIGLQGQLRLKSSSVLIVGAGGLGCPAAAYLSGAGVGIIGIIDGDEVETSNLHRQVLHSSQTVGLKKVDSAISYLKILNPNLTYIAHPQHLTPQNASSIVSSYDLVLDCTDHPTSRYLISDICVLLQKPLISASALRTDGQLIVLNSPPLPSGNDAGGPCYRCIFPKPPPAETVVSCGDGGIIGPVVGVMGVMQALEAVKMITGGKKSSSKESSTAAETKNSEPSPSMLLFSGLTSPPFRTIRLRGRRKDCLACSASSSLTQDGLASGSMDYVRFCGVVSPVSLLKPEERISAVEYANVRRLGKKHVLLDVRDKVQFDICHLEGSVNVPFPSIQGSWDEKSAWLDKTEGMDIYVLCRLGNDSQVVTKKIKEAGLVQNGNWIGDIRGGLRAWRDEVDNNWPEY